MRLRTGINVVVICMLLLAGGPLQAVPQDIVLVLDNSGSMKTNDPGFIIKDAVTQFIGALGDSARVGVVVFDRSVSGELPFVTLADGGRWRVLDSLGFITYRGQYTNSADALEHAAAVFGEVPAGTQKVIVFLTDGILDTGNRRRDRSKLSWLKQEFAAASAAAGITIYGIRFTRGADSELLEVLSEVTGGQSYVALRAADLVPVLVKVAEDIDQAGQQPASGGIDDDGGDAVAPPLAPIDELEADGEMVPGTVDAAGSENGSEMEVIAEANPLGSEPLESSNTEPAAVGAEDESGAKRTAIEGDRGSVTDEAAALPFSGVDARLQQWWDGIVGRLDPQFRLPVLAGGGIALLLMLIMLLRRRKSVVSPVDDVVASTAESPQGDEDSGGQTVMLQVPQQIEDVALGDARLDDLSGVTKMLRHPLTGVRTLITRLDSIDDPAVAFIQLPRDSISRHHATITHEGSLYWIEDNRSTNGTFVNGERIGERRRLRDGDKIRFSRFEFVFVASRDDATMMLPASSVPEENKTVMLNPK